MITGIILFKAVTEICPKYGCFNDEAISSFPESPLYIYIGNPHPPLSGEPLHISRQLKTDTFEKAIHKIQELFGAGIIPDFIIVDQSLDEVRITDFVLWLHSQRWSSSIPVLYNETILGKTELKKLKESGLVDGILNVEDFCNYTGPTILNTN